MKSAKDQKNTWRRLLPGLLISAICLIVVLFLAKPRQLLLALQLADYRLVLGGMFISLTWLAIRAVVWRTLLKEKPTFSQSFFTLAEGYLISNLLPFRLGELARTFLMSEKASLPFFEVFSTIVIERLLDLAMATSMVIISLLFVVGADWALEAALALGGVVIIGMIALYLMALNRDKFSKWFTRLTSRWPTFQRILGIQMQAFFNGLGVITQPALFFKVVVWMTFNWLVGIFQYWVMMRAFYPEASFLMAAFTLGVTALGIAAPSSPGAIGVMELAVIGALSVFSVNPSTGLAFALTLHISGFLINGFLGVLGLARDGETFSGLYHRLRSLRQNLYPAEP